MATLRLANFKGQVLKISPKLLQNEVAQVAENCNIDSGALEPIYDFTEIRQANSFYVTVNSSENFSSASSYYIGDIVYYSTTNKNYIAIKNNTATSIEPDNAVGNQYWSLIDIYVIESETGTAEESTITCDAASYLSTTGSGDYFKLYTPDLNIYLWFNVDSGNTDPKLTDNNLINFYGIQVNVTSTDTNTQVATKLKTVFDTYTSTLDNKGLFSSVTLSTASITFINKYSGDVTASSIGTISGGSWLMSTDIVGTDPTFVFIGGNVSTIYQLDGTWLQWTTDVDIVRSTIPDNNNRIYYTGDSFPKQTNATLATSGDEITWPTTSYRLGIPAPLHPLTVSVNSTGTINEDLTTSYVYTYVTSWGEEGAPSPPSNEVTIAAADLDSIDITGFENGIGQSLNIEKVRIYRINVGNEFAEYQLVNTDDTLTIETAIASGYNDDIPSASLGETLSTYTYTNTNNEMIGIIEYGHGVYAAFKGNDIYFSEPFKPYAWPSDYYLNISEDIVGLGSMGGAIVVCTGSAPSIIQGTHPSNMIQTRLPYDKPCTSKKSIVSNKYGVTYSCPDGLFLLNNDSGVVLTDKIYSKEQWQSFDINNLVGVFHDGKYYGIFINSGEGFIIDYENLDYILTISLTNKSFLAAFSNATTLYFLIEDEDTNTEYIYSYNTSDTAIAYTWKSKKFQLLDYKSFSIGRVICSGTATLKMYIDGILSHTQSINNDTLFRLPAIKRGKEIEIQIEGTAIVDVIDLATSVRELKNG